MAIALMITDRDTSRLQERLQSTLPNTDIYAWPNIPKPEEITFALLWKQAPDSLAEMVNLKGMMSFGAGVESIVADKTLPQAVPLSRVVNRDLTEQMGDYLLACVYGLKCRFTEYAKQQVHADWKMLRRARVNRVLVLGLGEIGLDVAKRLKASGLEVVGWSRSSKTGLDFECFSGSNALFEQLGLADFVINILPATAQTNGLANTEFFAAMKPQSYFINVGRSQFVDHAALISALESEHLAGAQLDVFDNEPLPEDNLLWRVKNLHITPHIAAVTSQRDVIEQIASNYRNLANGHAMAHLVDIELGY